MTGVFCNLYKALQFSKLLIFKLKYAVNGLLKSLFARSASHAVYCNRVR